MVTYGDTHTVTTISLHVHLFFLFAPPSKCDTEIRVLKALLLTWTT